MRPAHTCDGGERAHRCLPVCTAGLIASGAIGEVVTLHVMGAGGWPKRSSGVPSKGGFAGPRDQNEVLAEAGMPAYNAVLKGEDAVRSSQLDKAWRGVKEIMGGGVIIDGGSHTIRPMRMLFPCA